jgi:hypothetical protein
MMKKLAGLAAIAAAVGCDYVPPDEEFGYKDGPSIERDTDIGEIAILKEVGTNNTFPVKAKVDRVSQTLCIPGYNGTPVKYEWVKDKVVDKAVAKFYVQKENKRVDYEAVVYMDR